MRSFTADELSRMQDTQEGAMQDTCQILSYGYVTDEFGQPVESYTVSITTFCGLDPTTSKEAAASSTVEAQGIIDARLRLPLLLADSIDYRDRIKITRRYGVALVDPPVYGIVGQPQRGPSGLVLDLQRHETN